GIYAGVDDTDAGTVTLGDVVDCFDVLCALVPLESPAFGKFRSFLVFVFVLLVEFFDRPFLVVHLDVALKRFSRGGSVFGHLAIGDRRRFATDRLGVATRGQHVDRRQTVDDPHAVWDPGPN